MQSRIEKALFAQNTFQYYCSGLSRFVLPHISKSPCADTILKGRTHVVRKMIGTSFSLKWLRTTLIADWALRIVLYPSVSRRKGKSCIYWDLHVHGPLASAFQVAGVTHRGAAPQHSTLWPRSMSMILGPHILVGNNQFCFSYISDCFI